MNASNSGRRGDGLELRLGDDAPRGRDSPAIRHRATKRGWSRPTACPTNCSPTPKAPPPRGLAAIIAGAGGAAHLPGMLAAKTTVPVLGVPVASRHLQGVDSLYSIVQMPKGVPVATFAIGNAGAANAALFAVAMLAVGDPRAARAARRLPRRADRGGASHDAAAAGRGRRAPVLAVLAAGRGRAVSVARERRRSFPAPRWACWAAASWAACSCTRRSAWATSRRCSTPTPTARPGRVSHHHIHTDYTDVDGLARLAGLADAITTEFENVPAPSLEHLAVARPGGAGRGGRGDRAGPHPREGALRALRRRLRALRRDRDRRAAGGRAPTTCCPASSRPRAWATTARASSAWRTRAELAAAWDDAGGVPCVLEKLLPLDFECSVIVARGADGADGALPAAAQPAPRRHPGRHRGPCRTTCPSRLAQQRRRRPPGRSPRAWTTSACCASSSSCWRTARWSSTRWRRARTTAATGRMDACDVSQFELQVRTLAGLPLTPPRQHSPAIMLNLLGDLWFVDGDAPQRAALGRRAGAARHAPAPLRQDRGAARPQDGAPEHHRRRHRRGAQHGRLRGGAAGPADPAVRMSGSAGMILRRPLCPRPSPRPRARCAPAAWSPFRPKRSTAWAPTPAATPRSPASSRPRAGPATIR